MKKILIIALLVAAPTLAADSAKDQAAIKGVFAQIDACIAKADSKCLNGLFVDDATFAGPLDSGKIVKGKAGIVKFFEGMMQGKGVKQERSVQNVRFIGEDRAFVDCSVKSMGSKTDAPVRQDWHSTALMRRDGGKWLLEDVRFYVVETGLPPTPGPKPPTPGAPKAATPAPTAAGSPGAPAAPAEPAAPSKS